MPCSPMPLSSCAPSPLGWRRAQPPHDVGIVQTSEWSHPVQPRPIARLRPYFASPPRQGHLVRAMYRAAQANRPCQSCPMISYRPAGLLATPPAAHLARSSHSLLSILAQSLDWLSAAAATSAHTAVASHSIVATLFLSTLQASLSCLGTWRLSPFSQGGQAAFEGSSSVTVFCVPRPARAGTTAASNTNGPKFQPLSRHGLWLMLSERGCSRTCSRHP